MQHALLPARQTTSKTTNCSANADMACALHAGHGHLAPTPPRAAKRLLHPMPVRMHIFSTTTSCLTSGNSVCHPSQTRSTPATTNSASCNQCPAGKYASAQATACLSCQAGYQSKISCAAACVPGSFTSTQGQLNCTLSSVLIADVHHLRLLSRRCLWNQSRVNLGSTEHGRHAYPYSLWELRHF